MIILFLLRLFVSLVPLTWRRLWRGVRSETWRQSPRGTARKCPRKRQLSWCLRSWRSYLPFPLLSSAPVPRSARKRTKTSSRYGQCVATLFCGFLISYFYVKIHVLWNFKQYGFCHQENVNGKNQQIKAICIHKLWIWRDLFPPSYMIKLFYVGEKSLSLVIYFIYGS